MAKIRPFQALIYNKEKIRDFSSVVCPPYDVISPEAQEHYHESSPYNLIHILLGKDIPGEDKYRRAGYYFKDWIKNKILIRDDSEAVYFYSQQYNIRGEKRTRLGFICLLHLGEKGDAAFGHEHTRLAPKEDRLRLIKQVKANLSPIFAIFLDKKRIIQRVYQEHIKDRAPFIEITDDERTIHRLWKLDSPDIISSIESSMRQENIFIADGHHRYEVACTYREIMKQKLGTITGEENFNYVLTYFTNSDPRGLSILPVHRLLKLDNKIDLEDFISSIKKYFDLEEVKDKTRFFFLMEKGGCTEHVLGMYKDKKYFLLRLKNIKILDTEMRDKPKEYRSLDVSILNQIIFKKVLALDFENKENLTFSPNAGEFINAVDSNPLNIAFFLNPVKIQQVIAISLNGERMPAKSTYFYPKVLSGLVINKFNEDKS